MNSLWSLIQQDEYLIMKTQQNSKYFPRIYGTCGHIYVIEYLPPGDILSQGFPFNKHATTWKERATVALALLNLVSSFENDFSEPLHLCDMKGENFGLSADQKVVKAIDTDMSFFNTKLGSEFVATGNCSAHSNCDFFDCKGWCVLPKNMCLGKRINNNLQVSVICVIYPIYMEQKLSGLRPYLHWKFIVQYNNDRHIVVHCSVIGTS